jgi:hypothetical protein
LLWQHERLNDAADTCPYNKANVELTLSVHDMAEINISTDDDLKNQF